jgi:tetratricopeptide (TPR) repeat protein
VIPVTDVFVSYARTDHERAALLANRLQGEGWAVWWDDTLSAGDDFAEAIEQQLNVAPVVVVLWSTTSIRSGFVRDEANVARQRSTLVPVRIDDADPPLGFRYIHTHSLVDWDGTHESHRFQTLARVIGDKLAHRTDPSVTGNHIIRKHDIRTHEAADEPSPTNNTPSEAEPVRKEVVTVIAADDAALRLLRGSLDEAERNSSAPGSDLQVLRALALLADYLRKSGNHAETIVHYKRAERIASKLAGNDWEMRIHRGLAQSLAELGQHDEAIKHLTKVAKTSDDVVDSYALVMTVFRRLEQVLADERTSVAERYRIGLAHIRRVHDVIRPFFEVREWTPEMIAAMRRGYARALAELASIASDLGDHASAIELFEEHLVATTEDAAEWPAALEQLGYEYVAMGDQRQAPGTDTAHLETLGWYELAREIFDARGSTVGLRVVLRRCAELALALDDVEAFARLEHERAALGEQLVPGDDDPAATTTVDLGWPVSRLKVISVDAGEVMRDGESVDATVRLQNRGSLSWRAGRGIKFDIGVRSPGVSSSTWRTVQVKERVAPGAVVESLVVGVGNVHPGHGNSDVFVQQIVMPWDDWTARVTGRIPVESADAHPDESSGA